MTIFEEKLQEQVDALKAELKQSIENYESLAKDFDALERKYYDSEHTKEINKKMEIENIRLRNALINLVLRNNGNV